MVFRVGSIPSGDNNRLRVAMCDGNSRKACIPKADVLGTSKRTTALALLQGTDLSPWHGTTDWRVFEARRSVSRGTVWSPVEAAIALMASQARDTASRANGQEVLAKVKNKEFGFDSDEEMRVYLRNLLNDQEGLCAISGLRFQYPGQIDDPELQCSLDRIDSDGHYAAGNLQIVCRFINRWKSNSDDAEFRRLVRVLRASVDFEGIS